MTKAEYLQYKVSSKLPRLLGRESVSTEIQALFELVKNAYDADASQVRIIFKNIDLLNLSSKKLDERYNLLFSKLKVERSDVPLPNLDKMVREDPDYIAQEKLVKKYAKETSIIVEDNGHGMSYERLQNKWMKIGVSKDEQEIVTEKKRRVVGEKGVGRFAVERLSRRTILTSKTKGEKNSIVADTNWDEFENSKKNVTDIKIPLRYESKSENEHGLKIEMLDLRDKWTSRKIERLLDELSLLILPEEIDPDFPFTIKAKYEKKGKPQEIKVKGGLLQKAPYHFVSELTSDSKIRYSKLIYKKESIIPNKRGIKFEKLKEEFHFHRSGEKEASVALCGPAKLTFYGFPFDPSGRNLGWSEFYGEERVVRIRNDVEKNGGIRIYRDGFRVRPYGESGNDWLELESSARSTAGKLGNSNVVGWVSISTKDNPEIVDTTTREKIIENESFEDLKSFIQTSLHEYYRFTEEKRKEKVQKHALKEVPKFVKKLRDQVVDNAAIPELEKKTMLGTLDKIQSHFLSEEERINLDKESLMDETNAYRNLASLGITTGVVAHEIRDYLRSILLHSTVIKRELEKQEENKERMEKSIMYIEPSARNLQNYMSMVSAFTAAMSTRKKEFRKKMDLNLSKEFASIENTLAGLLNRWDIQIEKKIPSEFPKLRMYKADLQSILLNLLSNSIKSLKLLTKERKSSSVKNQIKIVAKETKNEIIIYFSDNGLGISRIDRDLVFDLFWTRTAKNESIKTGSGLGLPIIKSIVQDYDGVIIIEDESQFKTGVTFKISIPKEKIVRNG